MHICGTLEAVEVGAAAPCKEQGSFKVSKSCFFEASRWWVDGGSSGEGEKEAGGTG